MKRTCPHCGNDDATLLQDNGEPATSPDLTLLCVAPVATRMADHVVCVGACGTQWEPNA